MRKLLIIISLFIGLNSFDINAQQIGCGIRPFPPFGCAGKQPICICDGNGNCEWIYIGCN